MAVTNNSSNNSADNDLLINSFSNDGASESLEFNKSRAGAVIVSGDSLGAIFFRGFDGTNQITAAKIAVLNTGTIGAGRVAGVMSFQTHPDSNSAAVTRLKIDETGSTIMTPGGSTIVLKASTAGVAIPALTTNGIVYSNGTILASTAVGTSGQVLTSNGIGAPTFQNNVAAGIVTLDGDSGSTTGTTVTIAGTPRLITTSASGATVTLTLPNVIIDAFTNTFLGINAGNNVVGGSGGTTNTAVGYGALHVVSTGSSNTTVGVLSMLSLTVGLDNNSMGYHALESLISGSDNIAIGVSAGDSITTGSQNILIGSSTGVNYTGSESNNIVIGYNLGGTTSESDTLRIGDGLAAAYIDGIYGVTPGGASQAVIIDSNGQLGSTTSVSIITLDGDSGSATGSTITIAGTTNLVSTSASGATVTITLPNVVIDGDSNTFMGINTGAASTGADHNYNTALGHGSLQNIASSATQNVAMGRNALNTLTSGINNTAVGTTALSSLATTQANTAVGYAAGTSLTGDFNTIAGSSAGILLVGGNRNVFLGASAGASYTTSESDNIIIGYNNTGTVAENHVLRVGVGTGSGSGQLNKAFVAGIYAITPGGAGIQSVVIDNNGQLGSTASGTSYLNYTAVDHAASPYTVLTTDYYIGCDVTGGVITLRFPNAPAVGRTFVVKDVNGLAPASNITVTTVGGAVNIDGATSYLMTTAYESISLLFNGSAYEIY